MHRFQVHPNLEYTYTGPVYVRPIGRGVVLEPDGEETHLNDLLSRVFGDGDYDMKITFSVIPQETEQ